ncbi:MAG TPA: adenosylcobinamide-phosphate synthase CbiB [Stellaceae bacterium]|nr:adenosylcobinamide-phosphate synthase CbiB [Stellaceae bacterium]
MSVISGLHDRLLLLYIALVVDALFGEMGPLFRAVPHPVVLAGRAIAGFERRLNRKRRGASVRGFRGVLTVLALVGVAGALGWGLQLLCRTSPLGAVAEAFAVAVLLAQRSLFDHVAEVSRALARDGLGAARVAVSRIVGRDPMTLAAPGIARAAIESLAENFSDGAVAPAFWYLLAGLPGIFAYKMANTLDSMIGHKNDRYRAFGWAAARLDDLLNLVPAPISGLLIAAAAAFGRDTRVGPALWIMLRDGRKHRSPNAGWPEAAMAGALDLALAGPRHYAEDTVDDPFLGDGTPVATAGDVNRALRLYFRACLMLAGMAIGAWLAGHFTPPW